MSQTKGRQEPNDAGGAMLDTQPGVPELDLKQTLPTGAAFHATWRMQSMTPNALPVENQESGVHALGEGANPAAPAPAKAEVPPREAVKTQPAPHVPPRARPRPLLAQTLQMPLTVAPVPPEEAETFRPRPAAKRPASSAPPGWQSVQRVGDVVDTEGHTETSRPAAKRTDPMHSDPTTDAPAEAGARSVPPPLPPRGGLRSPGADPNRADPVGHGRNSDYGRVTLTNAVRVPELSGREWMFIGLLLCASAATLYSLLVDDISPEVEEEMDAASAAEHLVTPAGEARGAGAPNSTGTPATTTTTAAASSAKPAAQPTAPSAAPAPQPSAAVEKTTAIITDPPEAELLLGGAVVGNTPAKVTRSALMTDYLLRKVGYEPQVVRVSPSSPDTITVTLHSRNPPPEQ